MIQAMKNLNLLQKMVRQRQSDKKRQIQARRYY